MQSLPTHGDLDGRLGGLHKMTGDTLRVTRPTVFPENACNYFVHMQWRDLLRVVAGGLERSMPYPPTVRV